jgi:type II secretory pathway pseudopilin PulG
MMNKKMRMSYIEMIIIAVVLCLLAVRVAPSLTEANPQSKISRLIDGLEKMRSHLDLYRARHQGCLPEVDSFAGFQTIMTKRADRRGPYLRKIPANPFNNLRTVRFDGGPAGKGTAGWRLDTDTGVFQADDSVEHANL